VSPRQQRPQPQQPDAGVSDLNTSGSGSGGHALSLSQKSQEYKYCDDSSEATSATVRRGCFCGAVMLCQRVSQLKL
jgi:hypothetical protein